MAFILEGALVALLPILAAIVLVGLSQAASAQHGTATTGTWVDWLTGKAEIAALSGFAAGIARWIVSHFAAGQLRVLARFFQALGTLTLGTFVGNYRFAEAIVSAVEHVLHRGDPRARARAQTANRHAIHAGHAATHANAHARHVGHALDGYKARTEPRIRHATHAVDVTLPRDIGRVRRREDALSRDLGKLRERTKSLEDGAVDTWDWIRTHPLSGVTGLFAGAVVVALTRLGYGFLRCRSWRQVGRRLTCGMGASLLGILEAVATFALGLVAVLKPEVLAQDAVDAVDGIEFILTKILEN